MEHKNSDNSSAPATREVSSADHIGIPHEIVRTTKDLDILFRTYHDSHDMCYRHWHGDVEILYITGGCLHFTINNHRDTLRAGDLILVNSRFVHSTDGSPGNDSILLQIPADLMRRYLPDFDSSYYDFNTHLQEMHHQTHLAQVKATLEKMALLEELKPDGYLLRFHSLLFEFLYLVHHYFRIPLREAPAARSREELESISPVLDYTNTHYAEAISTADAAALTHLQTEYFCRKFRRLMGQTYLSYLNDVRMTHVYEDLIHTDGHLNVILERHGFTNYKLFRRLFREKFGCTPMELRKRGIEDKDSVFLKQEIYAGSSDPEAPDHDQK